MTFSICIIYITYNNIHKTTAYLYGSNMKSSENGKGRVVHVHSMKEYRGRSGIIPLIHTSALDKIRWSTSRPDRFKTRA